MRRRSSIAATLVSLVVAVSCSGGSDEARVVGSAPQSTEAVPDDVATTESSTTAATSSDAAIAEFDDAELARSLGAINESALADPDALRAEAMVGLDASEPNRRFASVLALTMTASTADPASVEALRTLASSPDVSERLLAAGALAALGEKTAVDVLIEALVSEELLRNVDPPFAAWRYARANLLLFIDQDLGLADARDAAAAAAAQPAWMDWWAANAADLTWNAELGRYEAPA